MLKFYHAPYSRSSGILWLLEELGVAYEVEHINIRAPGGVPDSYRNIQPHKKVPAIMHDGIVVTERAAIVTYLCDLYPQLGLAPSVGSPLRGPYLSALVYCDSVMDPVIAASAQGWDYRPNAFSFGSFDDMIHNIEKKLSQQSYIVGNDFTAADTQVASALHWAINLFKLVPEKEVFKNYFSRVLERPAFHRAHVIDRDIAAETERQWATRTSSARPVT